MPTVFGSSSRTAQITSTLPVKYRNHWPSPIFSNMATCVSAPASFVAPAIRNAAAANACKTQSVTFRAFDGCDSSDKATTELSDMRHFSFRVSSQRNTLRSVFKPSAPLWRSVVYSPHRVSVITSIADARTWKIRSLMFGASDGCDIENGNTHAKERPL